VWKHHRRQGHREPVQGRAPLAADRECSTDNRDRERTGTHTQNGCRLTEPMRARSPNLALRHPSERQHSHRPATSHHGSTALPRPWNASLPSEASGTALCTTYRLVGTCAPVVVRSRLVPVRSRIRRTHALQVNLGGTIQRQVACVAALTTAWHGMARRLAWMIELSNNAMQLTRGD
jgi:hypothetical protein